MGLDMSFYKTNKSLTNSEMLRMVNNYYNDIDAELNEVFTEIGYFRKKYNIMDLCVKHGVKLEDDIFIRLTKDNISDVIIDLTKDYLNKPLNHVMIFFELFNVLCEIRCDMGEFDLLLINSY